MRCTQRRTCTEKKKFPFTTFSRSAIAAFIGNEEKDEKKKRGKGKREEREKKERKGVVANIEIERNKEIRRKRKRGKKVAMSKLD